MDYVNIIYALAYLGLAVFFYFLSRETDKDLQKYLNTDFKIYYGFERLIVGLITPYDFLRPTKDFKWAYFLLVFSSICMLMVCILAAFMLGELGIIPIHWRPF